jgi:uncharacterized membrane protein YraQ (UPF0718 family)/YHS domain-containing protein
MTATALLAGAGWLSPIGRGLREAFFMFWETLWPLVLGFGLSGAVQAFVSREALQRKLGNHRPAAILRASVYGTASSSCSYAASAMAKALFAKGADFVASLVFMVASTNLVVELGVVLVVLMGWQFAASEFVGGVIMIVLLALLGGLWFRGRTVVAARQRVANEAESDHRDGHALAHAREGQDPTDEDHIPDEGWCSRVRSKAGWADASTYTMSDLSMLRRELLIGYVVAGFLTVLVPTGAWNAVFLHGHGFWTSAENVVVGPFVAIISFVCSIGNVPLAAALWRGGISFGGVVSFIFADLITLPLLLIYRRFYGTRLMLRILALFWLVMAVAGLATEGIFRAAGLVPSTRPRLIAPDRFSWNYTTYLNLIFLVLFGLMYWAYRNRARLGGGRGSALDPVCGMQVDLANAPASCIHEAQQFYFCSDHCRGRFEESPERFITTGKPPVTTNAPT